MGRPDSESLVGTGRGRGFTAAEQTLHPRAPRTPHSEACGLGQWTVQPAHGLHPSALGGFCPPHPAWKAGGPSAGLDWGADRSGDPAGCGQGRPGTGDLPGPPLRRASCNPAAPRGRRRPPRPRGAEPRLWGTRAPSTARRACPGGPGPGPGLRGPLTLLSQSLSHCTPRPSAG